MKVWKLALILLWRTLLGQGRYDVYVVLNADDALPEDVARDVGAFAWEAHSVSWAGGRDRFLCISGEAEEPAHTETAGAR